MRSENLVSSQLSFKFSLFQVKLDPVVFPCPKTTFENKAAFIGLRWKQKYPLKTSFIPKWNQKGGFTPWNSTNNNWTQFGVLKTFFENNWAFVGQFRKRKYILKRLFNLWQCRFSANWHQTRYNTFAGCNSIFDCKYIWTRIPNLKTSKRSSNAENVIAFWKIVPFMQNYIQKIVLLFCLRLDICRKRPKPHLKPSKRYLHTVLKEKNFPKMSFVRKFKAKVGFAHRTQLTINN